MRDLAAAKLHNRFNAISFSEKTNGVVLLEVVVVIVGVGAEFQLLHLDNVLLLFCFVLLFLVLVLPLTVVHGFGDGRFSGRRNQNEIKPEILGTPHSGGRRHYLDGAVGKYRANFPGAYCFVYVFSDARTARRKISGWQHL